MLEMNKEEKKNKDAYESEVEKQASELAVFVITALTALFFCVQIATGGGINYGLWALIFAGNGTTSWVKYVKLRKKSMLSWAISDTIVTALLSAFHIYNLVIA